MTVNNSKEDLLQWVVVANQQVKEKEYWMSRFSGDWEKTGFLPDFDTRPVGAGPAVANWTFAVPAELSARLMKLCRDNDLKLHIILLANLALLLSRYADCREVGIGSPVLKQDQSLQLINTILAFLIPVDECLDFKEFLAEVQKIVVNATENQNFPLRAIPHLLRLANQESGFPLFDVALVLHTIHDRSYLDDIDCPMVFSFSRQPAGLGGRLDYNARLFRESTVEQICRHFIHLLSGVVEKPGSPLASIDLCTQEERQKIMDEFNVTSAPLPADRTITDLFMDRVEKDPHRLALKAWTSRREGAAADFVESTYRALAERAEKLAQDLRHQGITPGCLVALLLPPSDDMIIAILGVLKTGAAYLPIDLDLPEERIRYILADSGAEIVIDPQTVGANCCSPIQDIGAECKGERQFAPTDLAYVIYTSGSTGRPKGVLVEHRNLVANVCAFISEFGIKAEDTVLQQASYSFDAFAEEVFPVLLQGGKLAVASRPEVLDIDLLAAFIRRHRVDIIDCSPLLLNELNRVAGLSCLHTVISGGDVLRREYVGHFLDYCRVYNTYGPTETTVCATYYRLSGEETTRIPIGKPIANYRVYILDKLGLLLPPGVTGELCIAGAGVTRGYLNNPELTAEKFVGGLYKTGDLARWLPDGNIEFLGRLDAQVKIRGYRIELHEIETQLLQHPAIIETAVLPRANDQGEPYLCAYVATGEHDRTGISAQELRQYLWARLPDYMIPAFFVFLDKLPRTSSGKIDKRALPAPRIIDEAAYAPPGNPLEEKLVQIWARALGVEPGELGIDANFFNLGGNSLKAIVIAGQIHQEMHRDLPMTDIFKSPTIRGIASLLQGAQETRRLPLEPAEKREYYPISSAQLRLYLTQQMNLESTAYNMPKTLEIHGDMDLARLAAVFKSLIGRHESLRTSFHLVEETPVQRVHEQVAFELEVYELEGPKGHQGHKGQELIEPIIQGFVRPFDLEKPPLLRVGLIPVTDDRHLLLLDMHHIVCDGVSVDIMTRDFLNLVAGLDLPPLPLQYKDYCQWQNSDRQRQDMKRQETYWLGEFAGEIPLLSLPTDFPRQGPVDFSGASLGFEIDPDRTRALRELAKTQGLTIYMVLLAAYYIMLFKLTGQERIVVGSVSLGRHHPDLEQVIGMFVNTLALLNYPQGEKRITGFLADIKARVLDAFENQDYPLEELVAQVVTQREMGRNPLFDVLFAFQEYRVDTGPDRGVTHDSSLPRLVQKVYGYVNQTAKFDLVFDGKDLGERLIFRVEYRDKLLGAETIRRFFSYYDAVLSCLVEKRDVCLYQVEILSGSEKDRLLNEFNATARDYDREKGIDQVFADQVRKRPHRLSLVMNDRHLTYRGLDEQANSLADSLRAQGVSADTIVAITLERSVEMIIGILGILKAGGAYLPIDPESPEERVQYMLADSGAEIVIGPQTVGANCCSPIQDIGAECKGERQLAPTDLAYIIYTSGSTGRPKGVLVEHRSVVRLVKNTHYIHFQEKDRLLQTGALEFDASTFEIWGALLNGLTLCLADRQTILQADSLKQVIGQYGVTIMWLTAPLFNQLVDADVEIFAGLKTLLVGGDVLSPQHIGQVMKRFPRLKVINGYGPTENTTFSTTHAIKRSDSGNIPIGKPISNSLAFILDRYLQPVPIGVPGELAVAGDGLARGYLNNPELTAERFVFSPLTNHHAPLTNRLYRTGDLARWLADGNIEFLGRLDFQVKIRGFRIELGEIEAQLLQHPAVREAVVVARTADRGDKYLCAYLVSAAPQPVETQAVREFLLQKLPDYMVPVFFVSLAEMPLTSTGKIDRKRLPEPEWKAGRAATLARHEVDRKLLAIWAALLDLAAGQTIGIDDGFFELGGHSLKAMILVSEIHRQFNVKVPLMEIFKRQRARDLADYILKASGSRFEGIEPVEKREYYGLSSAQKRLYFLQQLDLESTSYNITYVLPLGKDIDRHRLDGAVKKVIARQESLRTSFVVVDGEPVQRVHEQVAFELEVFRADGRGGQSGQELIETIIQGFVRPFDLGKAPLMRSILIKTGDGDYLWGVDVHHIVSDGTSQTILSEDFLAFYGGQELAPLRLYYKDFSCWQNRLIELGHLADQENFWLKRLSGEIPRPDLPADFPRPEVFTFKGAVCSFRLSGEDAAKFRALYSRQGATLYMGMLAALNVLLFKYTGQTDILVGTGIAGRSHADVQRLVGMFVNTLVMRNFPSGEKTFTDFLAEVVEGSLQAFENQDVQFEELVDRLNVERDASRNPLFDISMVVQNFRRPGQTQPKEEKPEQFEVRPDAPENRVALSGKHTTARFDITFFVVERGMDIDLSIEYYSAIFKAETIMALATHLGRVVAAVTANPGIKLDDIDWVGEEEKKLIVERFNATAHDFPQHQTMAALFEDQVSKNPEALALVSGSADGGVLTYRELDRAANRLAHYLAGESGLGPDSIVGILMDNSLDLGIAILGVLKAGSAYLPLDPASPSNRLKTIITDASVGLVVSQKRYIKLLNRLQWECPSFHTYLCPDSPDILAEEEGEQSELMSAELWNYVGESAIDDITGGGWLSSYTGQPLGRQEMDEYGDNVFNKLLPLLHKGMRVLEIGCASGITMYRVAPRVAAYFGTDISPVMIGRNRQRVEAAGLSQIKLACLAAHDIGRLGEKDFDLVIINSVIQCFHGHNYLGKVLKKAVGLLAEKGTIFVGDVMDQERKEALEKDLRAFKRAHPDQGFVTKTDLSSELFVSKDFFLDLASQWPGLTDIRFSDKVHTIENELTRFRYDALLTIDKQAAPRTPGRKRKYQQDGRVLTGLSTEPLKRSLSPHSLAYIIYTSGSTGEPKGVAVEHRGVVNMLLARQAAYRLGPDCTALQLFSHCFDGFVTSFFTPLIAGSRLVLLPRENISDSGQIRQALVNNRVSHFICVPSLFNALLEVLSDEDLAGLRQVTLAGEKTTAGLLDKCRSRKPGMEIVNEYGVTEASVMSTIYRHQEQDETIKIGAPIWNAQVLVLDGRGSMQPVGVMGELALAGVGLSRGYLNNPELTAEKFTGGLYKTGDQGRWLAAGHLEYRGRLDHQVKIRGFRIELGEIEKQLLRHPEVREAVVLTRGRQSEDFSLCAFVSPATLKVDELRNDLAGRLPDYMLPRHFLVLERLPRTAGGKLDRKALARQEELFTQGAGQEIGPGTGMEKFLAVIWQEVLQVPGAGVLDNFFDIGGNSINILRVQARLKKALGRDIPVVKLFKYPTIRSLAQYLGEDGGEAQSPDGELALDPLLKQGKERLKEGVETGPEVAVIGMAVYFPGATSPQEYWQNLVNGVESVTFFTDQELLDVGLSPELIALPNYVKARGIVSQAEYFDAHFFDYTPNEAAVMDPQVRLFHQCVWTALEDAGYDPSTYDKRIGLYAGSSANIYWELLTMASRAAGVMGSFQASELRNKDFMSTRIAYKLNLKGPAFSVQTACSTSLVAVHLACRGLLNGECEMAVAGGSTINYPQKTGYQYQPGLIQSPDGHCRAFDQDARGVVSGNGAGAVVLKRFSEAVADGDHIYAVVKGSAINNDGSRKVGFNAPSVDGQAEVIRAALYMSGIAPETIGYVEAHGTGTELGDPVEVEALKLAFHTKKTGFCGLGSVKTNIGHLDTAAGVAGLIKAVLTLKHRLIPPTLHFHAPNPKLGLENSPFFVVSRPTPWLAGPWPRRAGVSSLGIGGTNAHVVLEEVPEDLAEHPTETGEGGGYQLLLLSARRPAALEQLRHNLAAALAAGQDGPAPGLADVAYTLQVGRKAFEYRRIMVCADMPAALDSLSATQVDPSTLAFWPVGKSRNPVFLFPGQGSQYIQMGRGLYEGQAAFRREMDACFSILNSLLGLDLKEILYPAPEAVPGATGTLADINQTALTQPLLFAFEYALASMMTGWGIRPRAMIGHSVGEYVAACLSGVFSLEDALKLMVQRGRLIQSLPGGAMLGVALSETELAPYLKAGIGLSAVNSSRLCVVSGSHEAVAAFEAGMQAGGHKTRRLHTSHAFHSPMMEPILDEFSSIVGGMRLHRPRLPFISNVTGAWITDAEAVDPAYWTRHVRAPVRFSDGLAVLFGEPDSVLLEVGPGRTLGAFVKQHEAKKPDQPVINLVRHAQEDTDDRRFLLDGLGRLWLSGVSIDWAAFQAGGKRRRLSLPTYPFEKQRFWIDEAMFRQAVAGLFSGAANAFTLPEGGFQIESPAASMPGGFEPAYTAPRNEIEETIAQVWQEVLGFTRISIDSNFFDISGDSLTATQLVNRLKLVYEVEIPLKRFFESPTIAQLADTITQLLMEKVAGLSSEEVQKELTGGETATDPGQQEV